MIWDSTLLMGLTDAAIVVAAPAVLVVFYRHRPTIRAQRLDANAAWIVLGHGLVIVLMLVPTTIAVRTVNDIGEFHARLANDILVSVEVSVGDQPPARGWSRRQTSFGS